MKGRNVLMNLSIFLWQTLEGFEAITQWDYSYCSFRCKCVIPLKTISKLICIPVKNRATIAVTSAVWLARDTHLTGVELLRANKIFIMDMIDRVASSATVEVDQQLLVISVITLRALISLIASMNGLVNSLSHYCTYLWFNKQCLYCEPKCLANDIDLNYETLI